MKHEQPRTRLGGATPAHGGVTDTNAAGEGGKRSAGESTARGEEFARMEPAQKRGQVQSGIRFHSGNSPASSVDSRLNLDVLLSEGGGGEGIRGSAQLLWVTP